MKTHEFLESSSRRAPCNVKQIFGFLSSSSSSHKGSERKIKYPGGHIGYAKTCTRHRVTTASIQSCSSPQSSICSLTPSGSSPHHSVSQAQVKWRGSFRWSDSQHGSSSCLLDTQWGRSAPVRQELLQQWWEWASGLGPPDTLPLETEKRNLDRLCSSSL